MPSIAINFGRILILIGAIGYIYGLTTESASITALIPAFLGAVLLILGYVSRAKENLRKHLMHIAVLFALIGFLAASGGLVMRYNKSALPAIISQIAMALTCLLFVIISIRSFIDARKNS